MIDLIASAKISSCFYYLSHRLIIGSGSGRLCSTGAVPDALSNINESRGNMDINNRIHRFIIDNRPTRIRYVGSNVRRGIVLPLDPHPWPNLNQPQ